MLLLLINPDIQQQQLIEEKPKLNILVDQSASIHHLKKTDSVQEFLKNISNEADLINKFDVNFYGFSEGLSALNIDSLSFVGQQTDIFSSLKAVDQLNKETTGATVLVSDGNQNFGEDYQYFSMNANSSILPIIVGDTISGTDVYINQVNVNKYAFKGNQFPVELIVNYKGNRPITTNIKIVSAGKIVATQSFKLNQAENSKRINLLLSAIRVGTQIYTVQLDSVKGEKNHFNNSEQFAVEVIDETSEVLLVSSILHPDIGALKESIESNKQRKVKIAYIDDIKNIKLSDFQLIIIYNPNESFTSVFSEIKKLQLNTFVITGGFSNWNSLNKMDFVLRGRSSRLMKEVLPQYNDAYTPFQFENIQFDKFPPLESNTEMVTVDGTKLETLLFVKNKEVPQNLPLLATYELGESRHAVLTGQNIWKWRAQSFMLSKTFEDFDTFLGKLVQYLSSSTKKERLSYEVSSFYKQNEPVSITAQYFDKNFQFAEGAQLFINMVNSNSEEKIEAQMISNSNYYKSQFENLSPGEYNFQIHEKSSGIIRKGAFTVVEYNAEEQRITANWDKMQSLAQVNNQKVFFLKDYKTLKNELMLDKQYVTVQKSRQKTVSLIDWKILLGLLILSLSAEWFTRKYFGLI
ncbi:VWA domain-containing protein [Gillisia sp. M10.2A]|uniref:VWA domain-containing protein n=1 Tax=Gillisia lutea TaxID=2909668 RepID=A0ABS9EF44_9FLAO|nr:VWA domain-containing protein [Gillisia lutea]MCF4101502.1 VWA domain-containing protein [Gillisia lutea]